MHKLFPSINFINKLNFIVHMYMLLLHKYQGEEAEEQSMLEKYYILKHCYFFKSEVGIYAIKVVKQEMNGGITA